MTDIQGKLCQLCGPVTGRPRGMVMAEFDHAASVLESRGATVWNPVDGVLPTATHAEAMRACLGVLVKAADVLVTLPDWETSEGACLEVAVARAIGVEVIALGEVE